jgi:hypothetical protein
MSTRYGGSAGAQPLGRDETESDQNGENEELLHAFNASGTRPGGASNLDSCRSDAPFEAALDKESFGI